MINPDFINPALLDIDFPQTDTLASIILRNVYKGDIRAILFSKPFLKFLSNFNYNGYNSIYYLYKFKNVNKQEQRNHIFKKEPSIFNFKNGLIQDGPLHGIRLIFNYPTIDNLLKQEGEIGLLPTIESYIYKEDITDFFNLTIFNIDFIKIKDRYYQWVQQMAPLPNNLFWALAYLIKNNEAGFSYKGKNYFNPEFFINNDIIKQQIKHEKNPFRKARLIERAKVISEASVFFKYAMNIGGKVLDYKKERIKKYFSLKNKILVPKKWFDNIKAELPVKKGIDYIEKANWIYLNFGLLLMILIKQNITKFLLKPWGKYRIFSQDINKFEIGDLIGEIILNLSNNKLTLYLKRAKNRDDDYFLTYMRSYNIKNINKYYIIMDDKNGY